MYQMRMGRLSTLAASKAEPSGAHQKPRYRSISSAATNSATPHTTSGSSSPASNRSPSASDVRRRSPPAT
jgi:hypothetical protein